MPTGITSTTQIAASASAPTSTVRLTGPCRPTTAGVGLPIEDRLECLPRGDVPEGSEMLKIGVMGSASGHWAENEASIRLAEEVGRAIAENHCAAVSGACPGLPHAAIRACHDAGGFTMGISPAFTRKEHVEEYKSPTDSFSLLQYTGLGLMERDIVNIRSSDAVALVGGGVGTLNEFTIAYEEGKPIGVLAGSGGVCDHIPEILAFSGREMTENVIIRDDPRLLVRDLLRIASQYPIFMHADGRITDVRNGRLRG